MNKAISSAILLAFLSVGFQTGGSGSKEVEITLTNGVRITGEILALRDSSVVVANPAGLSQQDLISEPHTVEGLGYSRIAAVQIRGSSYSVVGLFSGMAIGCVGGYAIGSGETVTQQKNDVFGCNAEAEHANNELSGAALGAAVGALAGCVIGGAVSSGDVVLISPEQRTFQTLKSVARYPISEPAFLKSVAP